MRYFSIIIFFFALIIFTFKSINAQDTTTVDFFKKIKNYNLAIIWTADSIIGEDGLHGKPADKIKRAEPIGYIDTNYQRIQIHFTLVTKISAYEYEIHGKTKVKNNINDFQGIIKLSIARLFKESMFSTYQQGFVICDVMFYQDRKEEESGFIKGKVTTNFLIDSKGNFRYDGQMLIADGFCNNQFECVWTDYKSNKSKKCNWGDYRIPDSKDLDFGTGEFGVNPNYKQNGWANFCSAWDGGNSTIEMNKARQIEQLEWWK